MLTGNNDDPGLTVLVNIMGQEPKGSRLSVFEDCLLEDVPIRAVLQGWEALSDVRGLPPFWQII
jgi:hypothetical protein